MSDNFPSRSSSRDSQSSCLISVSSSFKRKVEFNSVLVARVFVHINPKLLHRPGMSGGLMYETSVHTPMHTQELLTDWTTSISGMSSMRRNKDALTDERPQPSPTYSNVSPAVESTSSPFPPHSTTLNLQTHPNYPHQPSSTHHAHQHPRFSGPNAAYYPGGEYDLYQPTQAGPSRARPPPSLQPTDQQGFVVQAEFDATPLLTTSTLSRPYEQTISQYYPIVTDNRWTQTPDKAKAEVSKRKRTKSNEASGGKALKTPKKPKQETEPESGRAAKRIKTSKAEASPMPLQLPTPPSTGRETTSTSHSMQSRGSISEQISTMDQPADSSPAAEKRRGVVVTVHEGEGRKLSIVGVAQQVEPSSSSHGTRLSPRTTLMPVVSTSEAGHATIGTDEVLQSEIAWLEDSATRGQSPPSSNDNIQLRTPTMTNAAAILEEDSPNTKAGKMSRRLQAFADATKLEEPMISTRIEVFGRVAVRKDVAIKFLGLSAEARLVEEVKAEDEEEWVEAPVASSSKTVVRPSWPDEEAPWALAGGSRREKRQREETERATLLKRYLENASDSDSEDEVTQPRTFANGRGKSIVPLVREELASRPRNRWDTPSANALDALRIAVRNRCLPIMKVGCRCGSHDTLNSGVMAQCSSCKTWHHLGCLGIQDENEITDSWWCPDCRTSAAMIMSTPASSVRGYNQSDERSSAFKGEMTNIALAPSPMFNTTYAQGMALARTPANRTVGSPTSRNHRSRILSYGTDMWAYTEDGAPTPSTPAPAARPDRFSTPRIDEAPFDVTSTPSRHLDFNFAQPSLFSLTPLGGRGRLPSTLLLDGTPFRARNLSGAADAIPSRHDFLKELNKDSTVGVGTMSFGASGPATPSRWPHQLLGAHNVSPSPFGHKRNLSGNKLSSMRSSSRSGLGHEALESDAEGEDEL